MALFCKNKMTPLQRRSLRWMSAALLFTVLGNFLTPNAPNPLIDMFPFLSVLQVQQGHASVWKVIVVSLLTLLPVLFAVFVAARYLAQEPDEFICTLVTRALLWGIAITMAGDAVLGALMMTYGKPFPVNLLNADLLFAGTLVSFRLVQWRYSR